MLVSRLLAPVNYLCGISFVGSPNQSPFPSMWTASLALAVLATSHCVSTQMSSGGPNNC